VDAGASPVDTHRDEEDDMATVPTAVLAAAGLTTAYVAAFAGSHPLAKKLGAWTSVLTVTAGVAAASWVLADRHDA
jgi:hypothetical protein